MSDIFILIVVFINALFGVGIFLRNPYLRSNKLYASFVASLTIWILTNYLENEPGLIGMESLSFFLRADFASAILFFYLWFLFTLAFTEQEHRIPWWVHAPLLFSTAIMVVGPFWGDSLIREVSFYDNVIHFEGGVLWTYYGILINIFMAAGLVYLFLGRRTAKKEGNDLKRHQINVIFWGSALSIGVALAINLPQAFYPISLEISRIGLYVMVLLVVFSAYAMARTKFFEMKIILVRAIAALLLSSLFAAIYSFVLFLIATKAFHVEIDTRVLVFAIIAATIIAMTFEHIRRRIEKITDKIFFRGHYDPDLLLKRISRILIEEIDIESLAPQITSTLKEEFRLERIALATLEGGRVFRWYESEISESQRNSLELLSLYRDAMMLPAIFDHLREGNLKTLLRENTIAATFPLHVKDQTIGFLILGHKHSGEPLSDEDLSFLEILSSEIAIGVQNAKSYTQIRKFNLELEGRVLERTKELETSQEKELAKAQEVVRLKDEFVFLAVHELRTPITAIRGFLELTEGAQQNFPKDIQENLLAIRQASEHVNQLVNDILEIAKTEKGTQNIILKTQALRPMLDEVVHEVSSLLKEKTLTLKVQISPALPAVICDPPKLKEVLFNLIGNAIKYNRPGGDITIGAYPLPGKDEMMFEIRDTGYGIPKDQQNQIFQKFFRAVTEETHEILGTGLGLFIVRMLVEKMGGTIMFTSIEHEGTTFSFTLPVEKTP